MKLEAAVVLAAVFAGANAHGNHRNMARNVHLPRQASAAVAAAASSTSAAASSAATVAATSAALPTDLPTAPAGIPPLQSITSGMPTGTTAAVTATYAVGSKPSNLPAAPPLPSAFVFVQGQWPAQDVVAPTNSTQVATWMKELEGTDIPDLEPTQDGDCSTDPEFAKDAQSRGWWTCGGWTAATDIVACPDKFTWGVSFDDGPSPYTQNLLNYLDEKDLRATFFAVGSRVIERPNVLIEEYMKGHEIAVHTWSHHPLTSLTNEQIVAELGWSREAIKTVLGVTPTTMRPPYGDIDNRVRAISMAMGLTPIMWTSTPAGQKFDTNDWRVAGGQVTGVQQYEIFEQLLGNASQIDTGFIVLQHDLFEITVDLAMGYTLNAAQTHNPPFTLKPIGQCSNIPTTDMYQETTTNATYLASRKAALSHVNGTSSSNSSTSSTASTSAEGSVKTGAAARAYGVPVVAALFAAGAALLL